MFVLRPPADVMGLQFDRPFFQVLQPVVFQYRVAVNPDQTRVVFHAQLQKPPLTGLDTRIQRTLERIELTRGIVRALHVM